jgi:hypothetical protein
VWQAALPTPGRKNVVRYANAVEVLAPDRVRILPTCGTCLIGYVTREVKHASEVCFNCAPLVADKHMMPGISGVNELHELLPVQR